MAKSWTDKLNDPRPHQVKLSFGDAFLVEQRRLEGLPET